MTTASPHRTIPRREIQIGRSVENRPIRCIIVGDGVDTVLIIASIHGNETAGTPLVMRLVEVLSAPGASHVEGRRVLIVPEANPDGMAGNRRFNVRGVDLNRNFPAENFKSSQRHGPEPLSEPESEALHRLIEVYGPNRVVALHQPVACVDYDGPGRPLAEAMAEATGLRLRRLGSRPGSLGSYVGITRNTPIITLELPRSADRLTPQELWDAYGPAMLGFIEGEAVAAK